MKTLNVRVITDAHDTVHEDNSTGITHYPECEGFDTLPDVASHKPTSKWGGAFLSRFDTSGLFTWVKPVSGGTYESTDPLFEITGADE